MHTTSHTSMRGPRMRIVQDGEDGRPVRVTVWLPRQNRTVSRRRAIAESTGDAR